MKKILAVVFLICVGLFVCILLGMRANNKNSPVHTNFFTHEHIRSYESLPVGIYQYYDVWSFGTVDGYHGDLMTVVKQVNITDKDPGHRSISTVEVDGTWIPVMLPRNANIPGQSVRSNTPVIFTGLLEVSLTKEGTKKISVYSHLRVDHNKRNTDENISCR